MIRPARPIAGRSLQALSAFFIVMAFFTAPVPAAPAKKGSNYAKVRKEYNLKLRVAQRLEEKYDKATGEDKDKQKDLLVKRHLLTAGWCGKNELVGEQFYHLLFAESLEPDHERVQKPLEKLLKLETTERNFIYAKRRLCANDRLYVQSNASRAFSAHWGRMFDVFQANFFEHFPPEEGKLPSGHILIFRSVEEWEQYNEEEYQPIPGEMVLAYYNPVKHEMVLRYEPDKESMFVEILWHEGTHLLVNDLTRKGAKVPMWIQEGFAEFMGGSHYDRRTGEFHLGALIPMRLHSLKRAAYKLEDIEKLTGYMSYADGFGGYQYAEAWTLVHFFMMATDKQAPKKISEDDDEEEKPRKRRRSRSRSKKKDKTNHPMREAFIKCFWDIVREAKNPKESFKKAFAAWDKDALQKAWEKYVKNLKLPLLDEGQLKLEGTDYEAAVPVLKKAVKKEPANPRAHYWLGRALFENQDYAEAVKAFENCLKRDPADHLAHAGLNEYYRIVAIDTPAYDGQKALFHAKAAALLGGTTSELVDLAETYRNLGDHKNSIRYLEEAIKFERTASRLKDYKIWLKLWKKKPAKPPVAADN